MNFMANISGGGGGGGDDEKEENEQPVIGPLLSSFSNNYHHHHHHQEQQEPLFSDFSSPWYNYNCGGENQEQGWTMVEREHMFDKVVTPSDVGKLNRLVIPKQHAERYFPLDSSTNYKGLLLNFEDRNGKLWRFQYSYWNSSQSYVMTKGWSRFVKEKKLDAGDVVSFQRGVGVTAKDRLFIDWRRRANPAGPPAPSDLSFMFQNHSFIHPCNINPLVWQSLPARRNPNFMLQTLTNNPNCSRSVYFGQQQFGLGFGSPQQQFLGLGFDPRPPPQPQPQPTPAASTDGKGKRFRLFGVNMDCPNELTDTAVAGCSTSSSSFPTTIPYLQLGREITEYDQTTMLSASSADHDFNTVSNSTVSNMSLDLKM